MIESASESKDNKRRWHTPNTNKTHLEKNGLSPLIDNVNTVALEEEEVDEK